MKAYKDDDEHTNYDAMSDRIRELRIWFSKTEVHLWFQFLEDRNEKGIESLEKCGKKGKCPVCKLKWCVNKYRREAYSMFERGRKYYYDSVKYSEDDIIVATIKDSKDPAYELVLKLTPTKLMHAAKLFCDVKKEDEDVSHFS